MEGIIKRRTVDQTVQTQHHKCKGSLSQRCVDTGSLVAAIDFTINLRLTESSAVSVHRTAETYEICQKNCSS